MTIRVQTLTLTKINIMFNVTSFDVGDNYAIGDPRKSGITFDGLQKKG